MELHPTIVSYLKEKNFSLRPLQLDSLDKTLISNHGQILMPTGTGKTIVEILTTLDCLIRKQDEGNVGVSVFASHRLLLNEQLLSQLIKFADGMRLYFDVLTVASDGIDDEDVSNIRRNLGDLLRYCKTFKSTTIEKVASFVNDSRKRSRHTLIVATYQSFDRLKDIPKIDIACLDEAHTAVEEDKFENVKVILDKGIIDRLFYFTATPVHGCNGRGMDNHSIFGPILLSITPRQAIDQGDILPPIIHKIKVTGRRSTAAIIKNAYLEHRQKVHEISNEQEARLIVSVEAIDEMIDVITKESFKNWTKEYGIHTIALSSAKGCFVNSRKVSRKEAIEVIHKLSNNNYPLILFHYDILTEGIDVPNLTAVLPLRELNPVKFFQTCGRAARLLPLDRELLKNGIKSSIGSDGIVQINMMMKKPCYWVIDVQPENISKDMVVQIRESYELEPIIREIKEKHPHVNDPTEVESPYKLCLTKNENESKTILIHEFELYRFTDLFDSKLSEEAINKNKKMIIAELEKELAKLE